jgi:AcrR family transcriptional regulator
LEIPETERERLLGALRELLESEPYGGIDLEMVLARADLDRTVFERNYGDLDACFLELWERLRDEMLAQTIPAFEAEDRWRDAIRACAWALCRWVQANPTEARILVLDLRAASELVQATRDRLFDTFIDLVDQGRTARPEAADVPRERAEAIVGAIQNGLELALRTGDPEDLPQLVPPLLYLVVLPYLGPNIAAEELAREEPAE